MRPACIPHRFIDLNSLTTYDIKVSASAALTRMNAVDFYRGHRDYAFTDYFTGCEAASHHSPLEIKLMWGKEIESI